MQKQVSSSIIRYTRNEKGQLNGCMVAGVVNGEVRIGMSKCCETDVFCKSRAKELATIRMNITNRKRLQRPIHPSMETEYKNFQERCKRYFKNT